jgi:isoleucyl-tRNA synthetase
VRLDPSEVLTSERPKEGWAVANAYGETVALDLTVTDELRRAGTAREVVRLLQEARKNAGLQVSDRIALTWSASDPETAAALREHEAFIADEVLAVQIGEGKPTEEDLDAGEAENLGLSFWFRRA